ncbi:MAG TPA: hypothetical protein PKM91_17435, partial [Cyclobacteriaceae bacterium]|nr:hypothetical protein [Cyclobacteriaceae bacterium]
MIDWYLPGTKAGGPVRSVYSLIELLKQHVDFYLITTNKDLGSEEEYTAIKANTWLSRQDIHMFYFDSKGQQGSAITDLIKALHPDLIYLNSFWSYPFSISLIRLKHRNQLDAPILLAPRGMLSPGALGLKSFKKKV